MKGPLSAKMMREGKPPEDLPFRIVRKYGEPKLVATFNEVRATLLGDMDKLEESAKYRAGGAEDRTSVALLRQQIDRELITDVQFPRTFEGVVDHHYGVKYSVTVTDRRK